MEKKTLKQITDSVFICMPLVNLDDRYMELIKEYRFNLEIGIDFRALDKFSAEFFSKTADTLLNLGIKTTVHAPYHEIFLGAPDRYVREAAVKRMDAAFKAAEYFSPKSVVVHLNFEEKRYRFIYDEWFTNIVHNFKRYAEKCGQMGAFLSIENVYEENPDAMLDVFDKLKGYPAYHCVDVGHLSGFSKYDIDLWFKQMSAHVGQFHLHDNDGTNDTHSPIGAGKIDFGIVKRFITGMNKKPVVTLEPHSEEDLWKTLEGFHKADLLESLTGGCP